MKFYDEVYKLCRQIPKGRVSTYREIGNKLKTKAYRAVGQALRNNPDAPRTPCHRILNSKGELHGFNGKTKGKKINDKKKMLEKEGLKFEGDRIIDFEKKLFKF